MPNNETLGEAIARQFKQFISKEAGQERRAWLEGHTDDLADTLNYYLGPGVSESAGLAMQLANIFSDSADVAETGEAYRGFLNDPSLKSGVRLATGAAAMAVPIASAKMINEGVDVVGDAWRSLKGDAGDFGLALERFAVDQSGQIPLPSLTRAKGEVPTGREYERVGADISDNLADHPSARSIVGKPDTAHGGGFTGVKSNQGNILRDHTSTGLVSDELIPPDPSNLEDYVGRDLLSIVGDNTGRHTVTGANGIKFDNPVDSLAGFEYTQVPGQGYAGAQSATASKLNEARKSEDPLYMSVLMGQQAADFAMHTGEVFGEMASKATIDPKNFSEIDDFIRNIGKPIKIKSKQPDGSFKLVGKTVYPYSDFKSVSDPRAISEYIKGLPTGTDRAYFLKGLDKAGLQKMGLPSVGDARLAVADPAQIGMDWGTTGYRSFEPDIAKGHFPTTPDNSTTYDTGVDKIGNAKTFLPDGSQGIPGNLLFRDLAEGQRAKGTGGGVLMSSPDYKVLESSPAKAKQRIDDQLVEIVNTFTEMEKRGGRAAAMRYAQELLSGGKITGDMIKAARKANAPTWMIAAMGAGIAGSQPAEAFQPRDEEEAAEYNEHLQIEREKLGL